MKSESELGIFKDVFSRYILLTSPRRSEYADYVVDCSTGPCS